MRGLHRFLDHCQQLLAQLVQLDLITQGGTESRQCPGRIILLTIEATVNQRLDTPPQWLEKGRNDQRGGHDHGWVLGSLTCQYMYHGLQGNDEAEIHQGQYRRERPINQGPVDYAIDLPQS